MKSDLQSSLLLHRLADEVKEGGLTFPQDDKQVARKLLQEILSVIDKLLCHFHIWIWSLFQWAGFYRRVIAINAALAGDLPSPRLQFPNNGVILLGQLSFSPTSGSEEEPSLFPLEPFLRNHVR